MFGVINVNRSSLSEEEKIIYQGYYCGLCEALRSVAGRKGRFMLNYDMTFLILFLTGMYEPAEDSGIFRCNYHPFSKRNRISSEITEYAAVMDILLSFHKLDDDVRDEGSMVKKAMLKELRPLYDTLSEKYKRQAMSIESFMEDVRAAEGRKEEDMYVVSSYTGKVMEEIFMYREDDPFQTDIRKMAFSLGQFIYIMDAYLDLEKDIRKGNYNPLSGRFYNDKEMTYRITDSFLNEVMGECAYAFERLPIIKNASILRNIIYSGVWTKYNLDKTKRR